MDHRRENRHLCLVKGKASDLPPTVAGPITRMGLGYRQMSATNKMFVFALFAKVALLASILYFIYG